MDLWGYLTRILTFTLVLAVVTETHGREVCNCNGRSQQCVFDPDLLAQTGSGFRCINCNGGTDGPHCEHCIEGYYPQPDGTCGPCLCHTVGSLNQQCDNNGQCRCKPGVMGSKCDQCQPGFHSLSDTGCRRDGCQCEAAGSSGSCDAGGRCVCKPTVTGERCDRCKPGYYHLDGSRPEGCLQCFCHGHSATCSSSSLHSVHKIISSFQKDTEGWSSVQRDGSTAPVPLRMSRHQKEVYIASRQQEPLYFNAPAQFLGDQSLSYGQALSISFRVDRGRYRAGTEDLVLEGNGLRVTATLTSSKNSLPCRIPQTYTFRLDELSRSPWTPHLSHFDFRRLLRNVTSIHIRATYGEYSTGYLQNVTLISARPVQGEPAPWVEQCVCPSGYQGQFCERCARGYRRESPGLGALSSCVSCNCPGGGHCDPDTGDCYSGDENQNNDCADCPQGQYNDPRDPMSCLPCPCSAGIGCSLSPETQEPVCDECPVGLNGPRCEICAEGYFGDPQGERGAPRPCRPCQCNNNIDRSVEGSCDRVTGECLKCIHNTAGYYCDLCKDGFFGNPLATAPELKCKACYCHPVGTVHQGCQKDGSCQCKTGFEGRSCDQPQCPDCYSQVSTKLNLYKRQLLKLTGENNGQSPARGELEERMRKAEAAAQGLQRDSEAANGAALSLQRQFSGLQGTQSDTQNVLDQAKEKLQGLQTQKNQYQGQLQDMGRKINIALQQLQGSQEELNRMTFPSTNLPLDSGSYSKLRQEAQEIANRLAQEAQTVAQDAAEAQGDTERALQILRTGGADPETADKLKARMEEARTQARSLETEAIQAAAAAERAHHDSMQTARAFGQLPPITSVAFQAELERLKGESTALKTNVDADLAQSKALQRKFTTWEQDAEQQLQEGQQNRLLADQLLSRANAAKTKATQAMNTGNATFYEIDGILMSLKGFGDQVGDRRSEAEDAMRRLPEIRLRVQDATDSTKRTETALKGAASDASRAEGNAREANNIASEIQLNMLQMSQDANNSAEMALALERDLAEIRRLAIDTGASLDGKNQAAERDSAVADEVARKALEAEASALGVHDAVTATLSTLDRMLHILDQPLNINEEGLKALEASMGAARTQLNGRLKPAVQDLELAAQLQKQNMITVEKEISQTLIDIQNLRDIRDNLPPGCYSTTAIEKP
ncbi:laminin subunit gamma-2 [Xenopus tropicalis]|uniref:Laminin subunit gamma-2 n=1 Tax=Xenopus tropicalis TaxID=8364 RepID=A0A6I8Q9Q7_XENTR|nr:laminin subunit gamma-2 [Xenopus tropicalis]